MKQNIYYLSLWTSVTCIVVFLLQQILPYNFAWKVGTIEPQFILSVLAHADIGHLLGNLFGLGLFGLLLESVIGSNNTAKVMIASALAGQIAGVIVGYNAVIGISGVVYGIIGALAALRPKMIIWAAGVPMPMIFAGAGWAFVSFIGSFANTSTGHEAHLGGMIAGITIGLVLRQKNPPPKKHKRKLDSDTEMRLDAWQEHQSTSER